MQATWVDSEHVQCRSPQLSGSGQAFEDRAVEMTINGQLHAASSSGVTFRYYIPTALRLSHIYPRGGPRDGGTAVTAWGSGL